MSLRYETDEPAEAQDTAGRSAWGRNVPYISLAIILCYTLVFIAQMGTDLDRSILLAGQDKNAVLHRHEIWRMLTGSTLHGGIIHYAMNTYAFYSFGRTFEMLSARWHVAIVFLLSAIGGAILTQVLNPHGISVGASGGIVGLVGYLAVYSFKRREFITPEFRRSLIFNIGFILFYGFVLVRAIDNFAHIGGLVVGAFYAFVSIPRDAYVDPRAAGQGTEIIGMASLGIYAATCIFAVLLILQIV